MTSAIIVAAGSSQRMGFDKLFADLNGKPVLRHTLDAFHDCPAIDEIIVVTSPANLEKIEAWKPALPRLTQVAEGGEERHVSVGNGIAALSPETMIVAVHDGARPLITPDLIARCIEDAITHAAAACARRLTETIKRADKLGFASESVERANLWAMETPQAFEAGILREAYEQVLAEGLAVTDEVSALQHAGRKVFLVENTRPNIKITFPEDLELARAILNARHSTA